MSTQQDVDNLLEGLQAEDLDMDLDLDLDYDPEELAFGGTDQTVVDRDAGTEFDDYPPFLPHGFNATPAFVGFVTGRKAAIPAPSSEALAKARRILDDEPVPADDISASPLPSASSDRKRPFDGRDAERFRSVAPKVSGFSTASGSRPPPISASARTLAGSLLADNKSSSTPADRYAIPRSSTFMTAGGGPAPEVSATALNAASASFCDDITGIGQSPLKFGPPPRTSGFGTASGRAAPPISSSAAVQDAGILRGACTQGGWDVVGQNASAGPGGPIEGERRMGFQTGRGKQMPPPSAAAQSRAMAIFRDPDDEVDYRPGGSHDAYRGGQPSRAVDQAFVPPKDLVADSSAFSAASGKAATPLSQSSRDTVASLFGQEKDLAGPTTSQIMPASPSTAFVTPRPIALPRASATGSTFRTPLRQTTNTPSGNPDNALRVTGSPAPRKFKPIDIHSTPALRRRVGLGLTPGRMGKTKSGFTTPFKVGSRMATEPASALRISESAASEPSSLRTPLIEPVFDLTVPPSRRTYRQAYLKPQYYTAAELAEENIPEKLALIDLGTAKAYHFPNDTGGFSGPSEALAALQAAGCRLATQKWVVNHWSMVLWKLAGIVQAQYTVCDEKWRWEEVLSQLLYRYEREINRAERPILRRIHERDSSPALPLILCVSAIQFPPRASGIDALEPSAIRPVLQLTDGWYRIAAQIDESLARAVKKGKITVGRKIAITGAKLEGGSEGADALDEADKSLLIISANSTSLAAWDAKLGRQLQPFVAGLSSLSVDGGIITLMDVIIDKVFPLAFTPAEKGVRDGPWDEEEERQRHDAWKEKYTAESSRLQVESQRQLERLEDIVQAVCSAAESVADSRGAGIVPDDDVDSLFDSILAAKNLDASLRTIPSGTLVQLASYSHAYYQKEAANASAEIEAELQVLCPERQVRDFRIVRIRDARQGNRPALRSGMLNVWDARALGEGALQQGKRYLVANVMPGKAGEWRATKLRSDGTLHEIYLHTRKDTRWQVVE